MVFWMFIPNTLSSQLCVRQHIAPTPDIDTRLSARAVFHTLAGFEKTALWWIKLLSADCFEWFDSRLHGPERCENGGSVVGLPGSVIVAMVLCIGTLSFKAVRYSFNRPDCRWESKFDWHRVDHGQRYCRPNGLYWW